MAVSSLATRFGYRTFSPSTHCPRCGERMRRYYDDNARRQYSQCMNVHCSAIAGKTETQLIHAIREKAKSYKELNKMPTVTATKKVYVTLPKKPVLLQITDCEYQSAEKSKYPNANPQYRWTLEVVSPKEFAGEKRVCWTEIVTETSKKYGKNKLWRFLEAAFNCEIPEGESRDTDDAVGRKICAVPEHKTGTDGAIMDKITSVYAFDKQAPLVAGAAAKDTSEFEVGEPPKTAEEFADEQDPF